MSAKQPFMPKYGSGLAVAPAAASTSIAIDQDNKQIRVVNTGAAIGFFRTYASAGATAASSTATIGDMPVPPGLAVTVTKDAMHDSLSHISPTGTTFQIISGNGW